MTIDIEPLRKHLGRKIEDEDIGDTQARLRAAHLKYHLSTVEMLQPAQIERYAELRGYAGGGQPHQHPR